MVFQKIIDIKKDLTTYRIGLLQAKAYRFLKDHTQKELVAYGLSTVDWAFLGLLYDNPGGLTVNAVADELGVKATFVTALSNTLSEKKLISKHVSSQDKRQKLLKLEASGQELVVKIEKHLRKVTRPLLSGASVKDILGYRRVLNTIIENSKNNLSL